MWCSKYDNLTIALPWFISFNGVFLQWNYNHKSSYVQWGDAYISEILCLQFYEGQPTSLWLLSVVVAYYSWDICLLSSTSRLFKIISHSFTVYVNIDFQSRNAEKSIEKEKKNIEIIVFDLSVPIVSGTHLQSWYFDHQTLAVSLSLSFQCWHCRLNNSVPHSRRRVHCFVFITRMKSKRVCTVYI